MKAIFNILALLVLAFTIWSGYSDKESVMAIGTVLFFGLLFFANIDKFSKFKAGAKGIEAETREVVQEAKSVTKELRELATILVGNQISHFIRHGRLGSFKAEELIERKDELIQTLKSIGVKESELDGILKEWHTFTIRDYAHGILGEGQIPTHLGDQAVKDYQSFRKRDLSNLPSPDEIEIFLEKYNLLNEERKEQLCDYRYYLTHKTHRRIDEWENHNKWNLK